MQKSRDIRNIVLTGFMGTGKSSVGRLVASQLRFEFLDTDELIEKQAGKTVSEIFATEGEAAFRERERQVVEYLATLNKTIISTGGGLGANPQHLERLKTHALVVCLWAQPKTIYERVKNQTHRPLLQDPDPLGKIESLLHQREAAYKQADVLISTEFRSVKEVSLHVMHAFYEVNRGR